ncbi:Qa-SNARE, Tlg2/Syntaxin16-family [Dorcoceras hygrometricum]|uniref:Qa-SNARE, Tlg2/Syntaxin16-family n=1 Tax=Dorcoceras hygrometricum TaxID=472368 RepID=A0A2Z7BYF4_9LAMI|nr:Qa-SNARE, Tlg2/Syntaxin16-family [Dorcoceras hygrometricum]
MHESKATTGSREPKDLKNCSTNEYYQLNNSGHGVYVSRSLQASHKLLKAVLIEASQQEESSATTLTSIEAVYRRQSEKIRFGEQYLGYRDRILYREIF